MTVVSTPDEPEIDPFDELHKPRRPWWILFVAVLAALVAGGVVYARKHRRPPPPRYLTARVSMGDVTETIEATGTVQPVIQVQVGSQVSGRISARYADYNTRVHTGDLLAEIDQIPFRAAVAASRAALLSAEASLNRSRADLELAERNLRRALDLRQRGLNAPADVDAAQGARDSAHAQIGVAEAGIAQSRAQLANSEANLVYTRILAPIDGIVITRSVDTGQTVAASFTAPVLFVIANNLAHMQVIADVDEADIGKLRQDMRADARVDAFQGEVFHGVVHELRFGPTTTSGVVTYPAVIDVENPEEKLRPGMTATVSVITARHPGVMRVPNSALRFHPTVAPGTPLPPVAGPSETPQPHQGRVYVLRGGNAVPVNVTTGISDGLYTEISSPDLHAGVEVVTDETDAGVAAALGAGPGGGGGGGRRGRGF